MTTREDWPYPSILGPDPVRLLPDEMQCLCGAHIEVAPNGLRYNRQDLSPHHCRRKPQTSARRKYVRPRRTRATATGLELTG